MLEVRQTTHSRKNATAQGSDRVAVHKSDIATSDDSL
jgi:hypothetical protein